MFSMRAEVLVGLLVLPLSNFELQSAAAEWTSISADNLREWSDPGKWWRVENGVFVAESEGGKSLPKIHYLEWQGSTGKDFELSLEYRIIATKPQDAGVNFRVERPHAKDLPNLPSYQAELDTGIMHGNQRWVRDGKLFGHIHDGKRSHMFKRSLVSTAQANGRITTKPLAKKFVPGKVFRKTPGWNACLVRAVGDRVQLYLNGVLANEIIDRDPKKRSTGDGIALQYRPNGGYRYEVRDLKFRPMTSMPAPPSSAPAQRSTTGSVKQAAALAQSGKLADAARMLEQVFAAKPSALDTMGRLGLATLYAALGEEEKHRRFCETFFRTYAKRKNAVEAERPAKAYLLFPEASDPALLREAMAGARRAVKIGRGGMAVWFELSLGMGQYRTGDHAGALKSFTRPLRGKNPAQRLPALAFAAMATFRQTDSTQARKLLSQAETEFQDFVRTKPAWSDFHAVNLAIEEAKALIR